MFDIIGVKDNARTLYKKVLAADPDSPLVIRLHLIRLLGTVDSKQLTGLLKGQADPNKIRDALSSAFHSSKTFKQSIGFINELSKYLEQVAITPEDRFEWASQLGFCHGKH